MFSRICSITLAVVFAVNIPFMAKGQSQSQTVQLPTESTVIVNSLYPETNYSSSSEDEIQAETFIEEEESYAKRTYFEIDFSGIPAGAIIHSANLYLTGGDHAPVGEEFRALVLYPAEQWDEGALDWSTQPELPLETYEYISDASSSTEDMVIDLTTRVRNLLYFPQTYNNYGFCIRLEEESEESAQRFRFYSEHAESTDRPYLEVVYELPVDMAYEIVPSPISIEGEDDGELRIQITQGNPPYNYSWSDGSSTIGSTAHIQGLSVGTYFLTVTDNIGREFNFEAGVGFQPDWQAEEEDHYNAYGDVLEKNSGYGWTETVPTGAILPAGQDGWVEYTAEADMNYKMIGFADASNYSGGYAKILNGLYLKNDLSLKRIESVIQTDIASYDEGDIVRVEKVGESFKYYLNGVLKHTQNHTGINQKNLVVVATMYSPNTRLGNLRISFRKRLDLMVYVENQSKGKTDGDIFALPQYGQPPYTYLWSNASTADRIQGLSAGTYTITVTDNVGGTATKTVVVHADPDEDMNWNSSKQYDDEGRLLGASKSFADYNGNALQSLGISTRTLNVFAQDQLYDHYKRPVITTLSAPTFHDRLDYRAGFTRASNQVPYGPIHFDEPDYTGNSSMLTLGEVHYPFKIDQSTKGELGWYYSDNNYVDAFQDVTDYPYSRTVYGLYDPKQVVESSSPHDAYHMGSGHEGKRYILEAAGELVHMFGYGGGWESGTNYSIQPNSSGSGLGTILTEHLNYDYQVSKVISYSPDGRETVAFVDSDGKLIASGSSGTNEYGSNEYLMNIISYIKGNGDNGPRYVDIHIPEGCEDQVDLFAYNGSTIFTQMRFDLINLITGELVFNDVSSNPSSIPAGVYRIVDKTVYSTTYLENNDLPDLPIKYKLNYYNMSLNYYDKKGQLIGTVDPEGYDYSYAPNLEIVSKNGFYNFTIEPGYTDWNLDNGTKLFSKTIALPTGTEKQFTNVLLHLADINAQINTNNGFGDTQFEHNPGGFIYMENGDSISPENQATSATYNFSSGEGTHYNAGVALVTNGGGTNTNTGFGQGFGPDNCISGRYFLYLQDAQQHCPYGFASQKAAYPGYCVTCNPAPSGGGGSGNTCAPGPKPNPDKLIIDLKVSALTSTGTELVNTIVIEAYSTLPSGPSASEIWHFNVLSGAANSSFPGSGSAVIDLQLSQAATAVQVEVSRVRYKEYRKYLMAGGTCIWEEYNFPAPSNNSLLFTDLEESGLDRLKLFYDISTHNMGEDGLPQHRLNTSYRYNSVGEVIQSTSTDAGQNDYVYTADGLLRFSQSAQQKVDQKFSYTNYDLLGRPIEMGVVDEGNALNLKFQNHLDEVTLQSGEEGVTQAATLERIDELVNATGTAVSYLDREEVVAIKYDLPDALPGSLSGYTQQNLRGRVACSGNKHTKTWYSYLSDGRVDWMATDYLKLDPNGGSNTGEVKTIHYSYNALGNVSTIIYQKDVAADYFEHLYTYDRVGNLKRVSTRTGASMAYEEEAEYFYDLAGNLKRVEIAKDLQGIDYTYNVLGMLKAINSPNLAQTNRNRYFVDPGRDGQNHVEEDIFGMSFDYFSGDYNRGGTKMISGTAQNEYFDGKTAAIRWNAQGSNAAAVDEQHSYDFDYFKNGWLKSAFFTKVGPFGDNGVSPVTTTGAFGEYSVSDLTYDRNGNIQSLIRRGDASVNIDMDNFTYRYDPAHKNRLVHLNDAVAASSYDDLDDQDTWSETTPASWNNTYDAEGQLLESKQEGMRYTYNAFGLVEKVETDDTPLNGVDNYYTLLTFDYDQMGLRVRKTTHNTSGAIKYTWYMRDASGAEVAQYEQTVGTAIEQPVYPILGDARLGELDRAENSRTYEMMDHLGNVRATFSRNAFGGLTIHSFADYYPFGSPLPGRNQISSPQYEHGYQGQFTDHDEETGLDAFELRMWDSKLARWTSTDPYGQFHSPYLGMGNNPVSSVDPNGGISHLAAAGIGAAVGGGIGYAVTGTLEGALGGALIGASVGYGFGGSSGGGTSGGSGTLGNGQVMNNYGSYGQAAKAFDVGFAVSNTISTLSTAGNAILQSGNIIRQGSTAPGSVKTNNFDVTKKSTFKFRNLSNADKVEILDQNGNTIYDVKHDNPKFNETFDDQKGTYFKFNKTIRAEEIFRAVERQYDKLQIRVTGHPDKKTFWSYEFENATPTKPAMQRYKSVRFL